MIKITPYYEHKQRNEIIELYFNMIAASTLFLPEDIFPGEYIKQVEETADGRPRNRTKNYIEILERYRIPNDRSENREKRMEDDALLAKRIIKEKSEELYQFLYEGISDDSVHVNKKNLNILLTQPMNKLQTKDYNLNFEIPDYEDLLSYVFCYDAFASHKDISKLLNLLGVEVCPYCNRTFITTLEIENGSLRAQIDHYKNKSKYPHLALSILNLIPACGLCNQIKGEKNLAVLYPYAEEMGEVWVFETEPQGSVMYLIGNPTEKDKFAVTGKWKEQNYEKEYGERLEASLETFKLMELYNSHREYVLALFRQRYIFGDDYLKSLCESFPEVFHDLTDVKNTLYLSDIRKENWSKHPLSKLTHDMDKEISRLQSTKRYSV